MWFNKILSNKITKEGQKQIYKTIELLNNEENEIFKLFNVANDCKGNEKHIRKNPEIFDTKKYQDWGSSINIDGHYKTYGHLSPHPKKGDLIITNMQSGKRAFYVITKIKPCGDPADMFFGDILPIGYFIDNQENRQLLEKLELNNAYPYNKIIH